MSETAGKPISCRAAVAWEPRKPLVIETIEVAPPKTGEVRVKMVATGVCHSDSSHLSGILGQDDSFPLVLGHEGSGIVESIGEGVTTLKPGDHVITLFISRCGECNFCKNPKSNICSSGLLPKGVMLDGTPRFTCRGKFLYHFLRIGAFNEYTVLPERAVVKIAENVPLEKACLLGCCVPTGYGSVVNAAKVEPGTNVAVWGLGGVGLSTVMGCKDAGAARIIGIDINPDKFTIAKEFGCTECLNPKDFDKPIQQVLLEMIDGGLDYTFECIGNVHTMRAAFEASHVVWGTTVLVGIAGADQELKVNPSQYLFGKTMKGSVFGGYKGKECIPKLSDEYMAGRLKVDELITHTMPLDKINDAFDLMHAGKSIRTVIHF
ncbi:hypothetical protein OS493_019537 [Desmophyllum pertusum]|uniref:Enoyl reductase (ER) domain-containing protein n=1 Tax=Desmophyllum pertusum TaxID=174260 RepID=A0A9W9ZNY9_9CNID|nr:hypothetical protein OS493_019537 [Desmophyllum pertusum]